MRGTQLPSYIVRKGLDHSKMSWIIQKFQKNEKFSKIFFFELNDSEAKKGQKNDENFFPY